MNTQQRLGLVLLFGALCLILGALAGITSACLIALALGAVGVHSILFGG